MTSAPSFVGLNLEKSYDILNERSCWTFWWWGQRYYIVLKLIDLPGSRILCIVNNVTDIDRKKGIIMQQTFAQRQAIEKYQRSPKGQAALKRARKRYERTRKAKIRAERYAASAKGKETAARCRDKAKVMKWAKKRNAPDPAQEQAALDWMSQTQ